ncbi:hypothetical protein [Streptomyces canus]|jgi:hypothetical protein|uniref:hypothetical protein n=1 Tax=Streptomyces canus TaxID=58343 RepID=UPI002251B0D3|nr:hypothetical protein [Streptomyces canus]
MTSLPAHAVATAHADNDRRTLPCRKKAMEMPKVSRDTATQGGDYGAVVDRCQEFGDYTVDFLTFREDVDHRPLLKGLPDDRCQCPHWGYVFRGELTFHYADHDEVYHEGDAFYAPAGHVPVHIEPGSEYLQISPTDELRRTSEVIMKNFTAQEPPD